MQFNYKAFNRGWQGWEGWQAWQGWQYKKYIETLL